MSKCLRALLLALIACFATSCSTPIGVRPMALREVRRALSVSAVSADRASIPSRQVLLRLGLAGRMRDEPVTVLAELHDRTFAELKRDAKTTGDRLFALAEYSYLHADGLKAACKRPRRTADHHRIHGRRPRGGRQLGCDTVRNYLVAASIYAYAFVFPDDRSASPHPFDPRLRTAIDLYNLAITSALRQPDGTINPTAGNYSFHLGSLDLDLDPDGLRYADQQLGDFIPAAQLDVRGLRNRYRRAGIGAPFLAKITEHDGLAVPLTSGRVAAQLRVPVTVVVRFFDLAEGLRTRAIRGRIEIYNETRTSEIEIGNQRVPLEYETSAALAYSLEQSNLWEFEISGFRSGEALPVADGLVMLQPYRPGKIPIVLVHGTASSPARWAEMLNEYQSDPLLDSEYQFWIFMYATGNPILYSAHLLRESLQTTLNELDPEARDPALRRMVVVGHSQGGLLTKLQAMPSGTTFWENVSNTPFDQIEVRPETRELLSKVMFFESQKFVERVVFISTPHHGSFLAGNWMGRIASSLFTAPTQLAGMSVELARSGVFVAGRAAERVGSAFGLIPDDSDTELRGRLARLPSSVDNMNPNDSFIQSLQSIPVEPRIHAHSIIPVRGDAPPQGQNDGVVEYSSAHIDEAESEYIVYRSSHSTQAHPETIQELRRILLEHLEEP